MDSYKNKYFKYKLKYQKLINQKQILYGGNNCPVCGCPNCNNSTCSIGKTNLDQWVRNNNTRKNI